MRLLYVLKQKKVHIGIALFIQINEFKRMKLLNLI